MSELNTLLISVQKTQKKLNVSYLETGIDQPHNYTLKTKIGRKCTFDIRFWAAKGFMINDDIFFKSCFHIAQTRAGILDYRFS